MKTILAAAGVVLCVIGPASCNVPDESMHSLKQIRSEREIVLCRNGISTAKIVLADDAIEAEQTAATQLAYYLHKVSNADFRIIKESNYTDQGSAIYIGQTSAARRSGQAFASMKPEEWTVKTGSKCVMIYGGRPRGTIYGVYHFLEDCIGIRWWNSREEYIPRNDKIIIPKMSRHGKPAFSYRDDMLSVWEDDPAWTGDDGAFATKMRLNRRGGKDIDVKYGYDGGLIAFPRPWVAHTLVDKLVPVDWIKDKPEWFALRNGVRMTDALCMTNPGLRDFVEARLRELIELDKAGAPDIHPLIYNLSYTDTHAPRCECPSCTALRARYGAESGVLLDFANDMSLRLCKDYPEIMLEILAYNNIEEPPSGITARDNIIVQLARTIGVMTLPVTDKANQRFCSKLERWREICKHVRLWDYAWSYNNGGEPPVPSEYAIAKDYTYYAGLGVDGLMIEDEGLDAYSRDMYDMKVWLRAKLLEDPKQDIDKLIAVWMQGYYGKAGKYVMQYRKLLCSANAAHPPVQTPLVKTDWQSYEYLDINFLLSADKLMNEADAAAASNKVILDRLAYARAPLDRALLYRYPALMRQWEHRGKSISSFPLSRSIAANRLIAAELAKRRDMGQICDQKTIEETSNRINKLLWIKDYWAKPAGLGPGDVVLEVSPFMHFGSGTAPVFEQDSTSECGASEYADTPVDPANVFDAGIWNVLVQDHIDDVAAKPIGIDILSRDSYHWYQIFKDISIAPGDRLHLCGWQLQYDLSQAVSGRSNSKFDIWASAKISTTKDGKTIIKVERVVVTAVKASQH